MPAIPGCGTLAPEQTAMWAVPPPHSGTGSGNPLSSVADAKTDGGRGCGRILSAADYAVANVAVHGQADQSGDRSNILKRFSKYV